MRRAIIDGDLQVGSLIENVVEASADFTIPGKTLIDAGQSAKGWAWNGSVFVEPDSVPDPLPPEIPMHKVRKALKQLGPNGAIVPETYADSWWMRTLAVIDSLSNPIQRDSIMDELNTAPNMVLAGASTQMIAMAIGMSDEQLEAVARLALTLP